MKPYYECHITLLGNPKLLEKHVQAVNWKFSKIDGDPVLGDGVKCYATQHYNSRFEQDYVVQQMNFIANQLKLADGDHSVIRQKVELIVYDTKRAW